MGSAIDHNHTTGEFRGLLCIKCNRALGMFLDSEIKITESINNIADMSLKLKDFQTLQFLGWFLQFFPKKNLKRL